MLRLKKGQTFVPGRDENNHAITSVTVDKFSGSGRDRGVTVTWKEADIDRENVQILNIDTFKYELRRLGFVLAK